MKNPTKKAPGLDRRRPGSFHFLLFLLFSEKRNRRDFKETPGPKQQYGPDFSVSR